MAQTATRRLLHGGLLSAGAALTSRFGDASVDCGAGRRRRAPPWPASGRGAPVRAEEVPLAPPRKKRVCCIGAGAAGLSCAKELVERGFDTTVVEAREGIGGVWRIDKSGSHVGVRLEQRATSSKYYLGFSDFPIPDSAKDFPGHEEYMSYLEAYVDHFQLRDRIRFGHRTVAVRRTPGGGWEVDVESNRGKETIRCDALAVCSGLHTEPDFPPRGTPAPPPGFQGRLAHARELKDARSTLKGQRIVVVGGGETGAELAHVAAEVGAGPALMSLRRGITVIGSYLPLPLADRVPDARTPPVDMNERRVLSLLPHSLKHFIFTRDKDAVFALRDQNPGQHTVGRLLDRCFTALGSLAVIPFLITGNVAADIFHEVTNPLFWSAEKAPFRRPDGPELSRCMEGATRLPAVPPARMERDTSQLLEYTQRATRFRMRGFTSRHYQQVRSLLEEYSGARHTQNFLTKSDDFIYNLMDHSLELRPGISGFEGTNTVVFDDGSRAEADIVVWATGYQPRVPFLSDLLQAAEPGQGNADGRLDGQDLYKNVFHPEFGDSLAFIGFARPQLGAMPPIAELQGRWLGAVLDGEVSLPGKEDMKSEIAVDSRQYGEKVFAHRLRNSVDFGRYTADVAQRAGCYPDVGLRTMFTDFALWQAFWMGPAIPQAYRISDEGARGEEARRRLKDTYLTFFTRQ